MSHTRSGPALWLEATGQDLQLGFQKGCKVVVKGLLKEAWKKNCLVPRCFSGKDATINLTKRMLNTPSLPRSKPLFFRESFQVCEKADFCYFYQYQINTSFCNRG